MSRSASSQRLGLMDPEEARKRAARIPVMAPGVVVKMPLEVALMWIKQNNMQAKWRGDLLVVRKAPAITNPGDKT